MCAGNSDSDLLVKSPAQTRRLPRHVAILGIISFLTAMSSAMVFGLLPVFLVRVLNTTIASVGIIEGVAEATTSFTKIISGMASDWLGRRKPVVLFGYALSAINKLLSPLMGNASTVRLAASSPMPQALASDPGRSQLALVDVHGRRSAESR